VYFQSYFRTWHYFYKFTFTTSRGGVGGAGPCWCWVGLALSCETLGQSCKTLDLEIWTTSYRAGFIHLYHYFESLHFTNCSKSKMQSLSTDDFLNEPLRRIGCDDLKFRPEEDEADFPTLIGHEDTPFCKNTVFNNNFNADFYPFGSKAFPTLLHHEDTSFSKNTVFNNNFNDDFYPFGSKSSSLCDDESVIQKNDQAFNTVGRPDSITSQL
jgi:hypothetical protein